MKDMVIVISGSNAINSRIREYRWEITEWESKCAGIRASFKQKTSRSEKNGKIYEYTNWYKTRPDRGLESIGKEKPDYSKFYPQKPEPPYSFKFWQYPDDQNNYKDHILLSEKDYQANLKLFKDCLAFRLEGCKNLVHPLYRDPEKELKGCVSVFAGGVSSGRSQDEGRTENEEWVCPVRDTCDTLGCPPDCSVLSNRRARNRPSRKTETKEDWS